MKIIIFFIIINIFLINKAHAMQDFIKSEFYEININNEIISDAKIREIEKIKIDTLHKILKNILLDKNFKNFNKTINVKNEINYLIKNIIIEDEFISSKKYTAKVKINFDFYEIIKLLRNKKIDYTDYYPPNILLVASENNSISKEGISKINKFYENIIFEDINFFNFIEPNFSPNDRFVLPFNKILEKDKNSFQEFSNKYNAKYIFIIDLDKNENYNNFKFSAYSNLENKFFEISTLKIKLNLNYYNDVFQHFENWWKEKHIIDNSKLNTILCHIINSNIYELKEINFRISSNSQLKSNILKKIDLGSNLNEISFYGDFNNLYLKLFKENISINIDNDNQCKINIIN